jgi:hypothetical protein
MDVNADLIESLTGRSYSADQAMVKERQVRAGMDGLRVAWKVNGA